jgi:hypothetical protein
VTDYDWVLGQTLTETAASQAKSEVRVRRTACCAVRTFLSNLQEMSNLGELMRRLLFVCCGVALSACSAVPGMGVSGPVKVSLASNPSGADVSLSSGGSCITPCTLPVPAKSGDYNATFTLAGYARSTVLIRVSVNREHWYSAETTSVNPNQVTTELQPILPPPQTEKR